MPKSTSSAASAGREPRSRLRRPCDACRQNKQMCAIPVASEPCVNCQTRGRECTFDMGPTARKRRPPDTPAPRVTVAPPRLPPPPPAGPSTARPQLPPPQDADPGSLELDYAEDEESHFVGAGVFSSLTLPAAQVSSAFTRQGSLAFRQVSTDERHPAYFIKHPSFLYGRAPSSGLDAFREVCALCDGVAPDIPSRAVELLVRITLPAFPFVNGPRLLASLQDGGHPPFALLAGVVAHCTSYMPETRHVRKQLWAQALLGLEDEYRQPRLRTLQLAILVFSSRPSENAGQCEIGLGRAVGAAQLLGLHVDPTHWTLPPWERNLRKRIWWTLIVHDKWRALLVNRNTHNVPIPTVEEGDWASPPSPADRLSMASFVATCHLTEIIDSLLIDFYDVTATNSPLVQLAKLERAMDDMCDVEARFAGLFSSHTPTGIRSFRLSYLGLQVIVHKLMVESLSDSAGAHVLLAQERACELCTNFVSFVTTITPNDDEAWSPYSAHHVSNAISLALRLVMHGARTETLLPLVARLVAHLVAHQRWDVFDAALRRSATLLLIASRQVPGLRGAYRSVQGALGLAAVDEELPLDADALLAALVDMGDLSWLDSGLLLGTLDGASGIL